MNKLYTLLIFLSFILVGCSDSEPLNNYKVIAHRGYWKSADFADNSLASLRAANNAKCYGVEFDICITKDDSLLVVHGDKHGGYDIATTEFSELREVRLPNGELVPTLNEYLHEVKELNGNLMLVVDIHDGNSIPKVLDTFSKANLHNEVIFVGSAKAFHEIDPKANVWSLSGTLTPQQLADEGYNGMYYEIDLLMKHPEWVEEAKKLGLGTGTWVVKYESEIIWCGAHQIDYVTTDEPVMAIQYLYNY